MSTQTESATERLNRIDGEELAAISAQKIQLGRELAETEQGIMERGIVETWEKVEEGLSSDDPDERWAARVMERALTGQQTKRDTRRNLRTTMGKFWPGNWNFLRREKE